MLYNTEYREYLLPMC